MLTSAYEPAFSLADADARDHLTAGLCLLSAGLAFVVPDEFSPRRTLEGPITDFRQVVLDAERSYYEFRINHSDGLQHKVRANYFDAGYYSHDPVIYNGVTVRATYRVWTEEAIAITALSGRHAGWVYRERIHIGGRLLFGAGILFLGQAIHHAINGSFGKRPAVKNNNSTSTLGI